jgi:hypothetical protein
MGFAEPDADAELLGVPAQPAPKDPLTLPHLDLKEGEQAAPTLALQAMLARHSATADPELVGALTERVADDARGALAGLTGEVRAAIEAAHSMQDLAHRLTALDLDPKQLTEAMARGLALAQLVGQAALLDELARPGR